MSTRGLTLTFDPVPSTYFRPPIQIHGQKLPYIRNYVKNLSDIMDLCHQSSAMCIIRGRRHTSVVCTESREPQTSHYASRPVTKKTTNKILKPATKQSTGRNFFKAAMIYRSKKIRLFVINFFERISVAHSS